jgi:hypothetical protein
VLLPLLDARVVAVVLMLDATCFRAALDPVGTRARPGRAEEPLAGVGGSVFTVPYLEGHRVPMTRAVAASPALLVWWPGLAGTGSLWRLVHV